MIRNGFWLWATRNCPEGERLPWWALWLRVALTPLDYLFWRMAKSHGYDPETDAWTISGVRYSGRGFQRLLRVGKPFEVVALENGTLTMRELSAFPYARPVVITPDAELRRCFVCEDNISPGLYRVVISAPSCPEIHAHEGCFMRAVDARWVDPGRA